MLWAKDKGIKYFDFGGVPYYPSPGSPAFGVYKFKKNFGGELESYFKGQKILSPVRAGIFNTLMQKGRFSRFVIKLSNKYGYYSVLS
jgi:lipid II:glycine glycyltransferase (peptidoglycan interpeptide bridge formation enzyme)